MAGSYQGRKSSGRIRPIGEPERGVQPLMIIMVLLLAGLTMLFVGLSGAMIYSRLSSGDDSLAPPWIFYINAVVLLAATRFIRRARSDYALNDLHSIQKNIAICLVLTLCFLAGQLWGWFQFFDGFNSVAKNRSLAYTFALSALHLLHVAGGIPFLLVYLLRINKSIRRGSSIPGRQFLNALVMYWNFIDVLWIALVALLLITGLVA